MNKNGKNTSNSNVRNVSDKTNVNNLLKVDIAQRRILQIGFGGVGGSMPPLYVRHMTFAPKNITIVDKNAEKIKGAADKWPSIDFVKLEVNKQNYKSVLQKYLKPGDVLVDLAWYISTPDLITWCHENGVLFVNTAIESWLEEECKFMNKKCQPLYMAQVDLRNMAKGWKNKGPTAIISHGANPGWVSHAAKIGIRDWAKHLSSKNAASKKFARAHELAKAGKFAEAAKILDVQVIHIAERDTQRPTIPKRIDEFVNTWSVDGFISEGSQPAELGWGTHEHRLPADGREHAAGTRAAIYLMEPGAATRVRTWTPKAGHFHGFLITHSEAISLADYYTVHEDGKAVYRPTAHYAYHPSDSAVMSVHEFAGLNWRVQSSKRILRDEIADGIDELGVLLAGHAKNAYWYGSQLSIDEARALAPYNSATTLQVTVSVLAGWVWAMENPVAGVVEPDEMDYRRCLEVAMPYLGPVVGAYTDWTPLHDRNRLFPEDIDATCPWQFQNVRV